RLPVAGDEDDPSPWTQQVEARGDGRVGTGGVNDDVVLIRWVGTGSDALGGAALGVVPGGDVDGAPNPARDGGRGQPDRGSTDDGNSLVTREPGPSERVQRARDGLHERGVGDVEAGGQRHEADVLDRELVGHAAVAGEAVEPRDDAPALAHLARETPVALT